MVDGAIVRSVTREDIPTLSLVLARAFDTDPVFIWATRQGEERIRVLTDLFSYTLEESLRGGLSTCSVDMRACAVWFPPDYVDASSLGDLLMLPRVIRWTGFRRLSRFVSFVGEMRAHRPREHHFYLDAIGVAPEAQGKGYGSALLAHTLAIADSSGLPAYLESTKPRNNILYERHGFRVIAEAPLPGGGPPIWYMLRPSTKV